MIPFVTSGDTHGYLKTRMKNAILDYSISQTNLSLNNNHNYFLQYPDPNLTTTQIFTAVRISNVKKITTIKNNNNNTKTLLKASSKRMFNQGRI